MLYTKITKATEAWVFSCEKDPKGSKDFEKFLLEGSKRFILQGSIKCLNQKPKKVSS